MVWTLRGERSSLPSARRFATAIQEMGLRVRIKEHTRKVLMIKEIPNTETRDFRFSQAGKMMDRADALKKYKSMG